MKKKIFGDAILNIISSVIPIIILQLLILPSLGNALSEAEYGLVVTTLSFFNMIPGALGNVLNNIRLLHNENLQSYRGQRDFNVILFFMIGACFIFTTIYCFFFKGNGENAYCTLDLITALLFLVQGYFCVSFLLEINYKRILMNNLFLSLGYVLGYGLFLLGYQWQYIYIVGYMASLVYIFFKSTLWKEPLKRSSKFKKRSTETAWLMVSGILGRAVNYADKLLLFPLLGGAAVSVYYVATVCSKLVSLAASPVNSVILTYLSKLKRKQDELFKWTALISGCVCVLGYGICILITEPLLVLLYPNYVNEAMNYIVITSATAAIQAFISLISPFVLRFFSAKWQVVINGVVAVLYIALCLGMLQKWGMYGLCIGVLFTNIFKAIILLFIYYKCKSRETL